jgi:lysozyme family protein
MRSIYFKIQELLRFAKQLDNSGHYKLSDILSKNIYKYAQSQPFEIEEGFDYNDPKNVIDYFLGFAYDLYNRKKDITKDVLISEIEKKVNEKMSEMTEENKLMYSNLLSDVISQLENQSFWKQLDSGSNDSYAIVFDANSPGFENALNYILDVEGGYTDYNPSTGDPRTNLGIIQSEYDRYRSSKNMSKQSVSNITLDEAKEIYFKDYWSTINAETIYQNLPKTAIVLFDFAVNSGIGGASSLVSKVLNIPSSRFDSKMINSIINTGLAIGDDNLSRNLIERRFINYDEIIKRDPRKSVYRKGWQNRLKKLDKMIEQI